MEIIDFSCNVNPLGPPKGLLEKINLEKIISFYPDHTNRRAIESLSSHYSLPQENLAVGSGSTEFFFTIPDAFNIDAGIVVNPTFWEYETSLKHTDKKIMHFKTYTENEFQIDFEKLREMLSTTSRKGVNHVLYLCQPNNPTSSLANPKEIIRLCEEIPTIKFIVDETYLLFRQDYDDLSLMKEASERGNLVVVTSFSKFFTVPGIRIGICCSNSDNIELIRQHQIPYGVNSLAQDLTPYLLESHKFIKDSREFMEGERSRVYQLLKKSSHLHPYEPQANFILVRLKNKDDNSTHIVNYLRQNRMIVRDGSEFLGLGSRYLRFSIRNTKENNLLLNAINDYYSSKVKPS